MDITIESGDIHHAHWFVWIHAETAEEAWAANKAVEELTKHLAPFCQVERTHSVGRNCDEHWRCPGDYGWEMWALDRDDPKGKEVLQALMPEINTRATEALMLWS